MSPGVWRRTARWLCDRNSQRQVVEWCARFNVYAFVFLVRRGGVLSVTDGPVLSRTRMLQSESYVVCSKDVDSN
jgi:hypothetical protein